MTIPSPAADGSVGPPGPSPLPADAAAAQQRSAPDDGNLAAGASPELGAQPAEPGQQAATEATSRSGQGTQRHEYLQDYGRSIQNVINLPGPSRPRPRRAPPELIELSNKAFAEPDGFDLVRSSFKVKRHTVILRGPQGTGKLGAAINLLIEDGAEQIFLLDEATDMRGLLEAIEAGVSGHGRARTNAGFVISHPRDFANLQASVLHSLEETLGRVAARLVMTVDDALLEPDHDIGSYFIDYPHSPSPDAVFRKHLELRIGRSRAADLLAIPEVQKFVSDYLSPAAACQAAADLAEAITIDVGLMDDVSGIHLGSLRAQMARRGSEDFETWFAGLGDTRTIAFAISLAVLNGFPYEVVVRAATRLYRKLIEPPQMVMVSVNGPTAEGPRPFAVARREMLHRLQAKVIEIGLGGDYGDCTAEGVQYQESRNPTDVILHAWSNYEVQDALLDWLAELATDCGELVRVFAGGALGVLATRSFYYITDAVLAPWAVSDNPDRREAVAYALRIVAAESQLRENVRELVSGWYTSKDPVMQATAARVHGLVLGAFDPVSSFEALERLAGVNDVQVAIAIGEATVDLLGSSFDEASHRNADDLARMILPRLIEGLRQADHTATMQLVFLILAIGLDTEVPTDDGRRYANWPYLLALATRPPSVGAGLAKLWRHVLNDARFPSQAEQVLTLWARRAESSPEIRDAFLRLIRAIVRGEQRSQMIIRRHVARWAAADNLQPLPITCTAVQAILDAENSR